MARRFRFRLEVVRRVREQRRNVQRRVVADAIRAVHAVEDRIAGFTDQLRATVEGAREVRHGGPVDLPSLRGDQFYSGWLHGKIMDAGEELQRSREELIRQRGLLSEATKQLKVIEKLREKQWTRHLRSVRKEEQVASDEAALRSYTSRHGKGSKMIGMT